MLLKSCQISGRNILLNFRTSNNPRVSPQTAKAIQIPCSLRSKAEVRYRTGMKQMKVANSRTFRNNFISPSPLKMPSNTKAIALMGWTRIMIKKMA